MGCSGASLLLSHPTGRGGEQKPPRIVSVNGEAKGEVGKGDVAAYYCHFGKSKGWCFVSFWKIGVRSEGGVMWGIHEWDEDKWFSCIVGCELL